MASCSSRRAESPCLQLAQNESCFLASARPRRSEAEQLLRTVRVPRLLRPCPVPSSRGGRVTRWLLHSRLPPAAGGAGQVWQSRVTARKRQGQESPASPRLSLGCGHPDRKGPWFPLEGRRARGPRPGWEEWSGSQTTFGGRSHPSRFILAAPFLLTPHYHDHDLPHTGGSLASQM